MQHDIASPKSSLAVIGARSAHQGPKEQRDMIRGRGKKEHGSPAVGRAEEAASKSRANGHGAGDVSQATNE
eukprot:14470780-Alexandrium_andersonii.AAC.1